jgi:hypothetical protein
MTPSTKAFSAFFLQHTVSTFSLPNKTLSVMSTKPVISFDRPSTIQNLRALAKEDCSQTNFNAGKRDIIDNNLNYDSADAVLQAADKSKDNTKAAVFNINNNGLLTILTCSSKHSGGKWFAMETTSSGVSSVVRVIDRIRTFNEDTEEIITNNIPSIEMLLEADSNEQMMSIISTTDNRTTQSVSSTVIVDWEVIQGIFLGPNSALNTQDILWHYVNLAKSDSTLANSDWFKRVCNTILQVELAQHDGLKSPGLATKPVRPDGKNHLKTIELVTNEFDAEIITNDNDNASTDSDSGDEKGGMNDIQLGESILDTIKHSNSKETSDQTESDQDIPSSSGRRRKSNSPSVSPSRRERSKRSKSSHSTRERDRVSSNDNDIDPTNNESGKLAPETLFPENDNYSLLRFLTLGAEKEKLKDTYLPKIETYVKNIMLKISICSVTGKIPLDFHSGLQDHLKAGRKLQSVQGSMEDKINSQKERRDESVGAFDLKMLENSFAGKLTNDSTINDPVFSIGITIFSFRPFGEEHNTKSKSGQTLFIPGDCDQFFQMMRALTLFITELFSLDSEFSLKTDNLYEDLLDIKKQLKAQFLARGKDFGRHICLLIHNVMGQFIRDMKERIEPHRKHINLDSLIDQIQMGAVITIPFSSTKPNDRGGRRGDDPRREDRRREDPRRDDYRREDHRRDDHRRPFVARQPLRDQRTKGRYEFDVSKNYGSFFAPDKIRSMNPRIPATREGTGICIKFLFHGSCRNERCPLFHGNTANMDTQIKAWIDGNRLPVKKRE